MPSDFISLLSADLDLESPKSLYSRGESGWGLCVCGGSGEARPRGNRRGPGRGAAEPPPEWSVLAGGAVVRRGRGAGGGGGRGPRGVVNPPPRSRLPPGAQMPSAPGSAAPGGSERPSVAGCPLSPGGRPRPPRLEDHPGLGPALELPRSGRRGSSYQDHPPQQSCPQRGSVAWSWFWVQDHHFSPPPGCLCAVVLPPSLSGLVHSLPLLGRPPSTRRPSFLVILLLERARIFFSFLFSLFPSL